MKLLRECWCGKGIPHSLWAVLGEPPRSFRAVLVLALTSIVSLGSLFFCSHTGAINLSHLVPYVRTHHCVAALPWVTLRSDRKGKQGMCSSHGAVRVTLGWGSVNLARVVHLCLTLEVESQSELFALGLMYSRGERARGERAQGESPEHGSTEGSGKPTVLALCL